MADFFSDLNPSQREAAACANHCLTIAAPGSGKTKMLAAKASQVLTQGQTVTAVTFTRDSALELRDRIIKQAGPEVLPRLLVGTFHSIDLLMAFPGKAKSAMGSDILKYSQSSLKQGWVIVKEGMRRSAVARAFAASMPLDVELEDATSIIEGIKSGQVKPRSSEETQMVEIYTEILTRHGVIDFQDILLKTNEGLQAGAISPLRCDHLLLDEYQDTDLPQLNWALHHAKAGSIITAVGDDDQSIYGFRRALGYEGMLRFETELSSTRVVLGLNYRSHSEILTPSAKLIQKNLGRMPKLLVSSKGPGGSAAWERFSTRSFEAMACARTVKTATMAGQTVGVLARTNKRLDDIESACVSLEIPYSRTGGDSVLNTRECLVFMSAFGCMTRDNAKDSDELLAWCGVDEYDLATLNKTFGASIFSASRKRTEIGKASVSDNTKSTVVKLAKLFQEWKSFIKTGGTETVVEGLVAILKSHTEDKLSQKSLEVVSGILAVDKSSYVGQDLTMEQQYQRFLSKLDSIRDAMGGLKGAVKKEPALVNLMTAHASKGLEFDMVWIIGADNDTFPDKKSGIQEERRLFFVAMTRARKTLWVSASGKIPQSDFFHEADLPRTQSGTFETVG